MAIICGVGIIRHSQGGVQFPTGGDSPRAASKGVTADTGVIPGPTVKVRMEENECFWRSFLLWVGVWNIRSEQ